MDRIPYRIAAKLGNVIHFDSQVKEIRKTAQGRPRELHTQTWGTQGDRRRLLHLRLADQHSQEAIPHYDFSHPSLITQAIADRTQLRPNGLQGGLGSRSLSG